MKEKEFIQDSIKKQRARNYLKENLSKAGIVNIDVRKTTMGHRILIASEKPGLVIGKKGRTIDRMKRNLEDKLGLEEVEIEVEEIQNRNLHPELVCNWAEILLKKGVRSNRIAKKIINGVMDSGAMGAEIKIKGVVTGASSQSRTNKKSAGYLKKAGQEVEKIREARRDVVLPQGTIGVTVKIVPPGIQFRDKIDVTDYIEKRTEEPEEKEETEEKPEKKEEKKVEEKKTEESTKEKKTEKEGSKEKKKDEEETEEENKEKETKEEED